jgi:hypothetical protein
MRGAELATEDGGRLLAILVVPKPSWAIRRHNTVAATGCTQGLIEQGFCHRAILRALIARVCSDLTYFAGLLDVFGAPLALLTFILITFL